MSMYLRAEGIGIEFPVTTLEKGHSVAASVEQLGGRIHLRRGKSYVRALDEVSLYLYRCDRLALVGHNGSGKSTLLLVLAGIYHPDSGVVHRSGTVSGIFNMSLGFRQEATGYRNLVLKGLIAGRTRAEIDAALPEIAEFTGLGPYLDMPLHTYSQGMAMRLAFAATTAFSNDILVMDEWIGAGDANFQEKIIGRMTDFLHASTIVVLASHSTRLLRRIANKALWLEHGRIRRYGGMEVIDEYEDEVLNTKLPSGLRELIAGNTGLWLHAADGAPAGRQLLWNLPGTVGDLQLRVSSPDASGNRIVRSIVRRCGAWPLAPWVRPGMHFEIVDLADQATVAELVLEEGH